MHARTKSRVAATLAGAFALAAATANAAVIYVNSSAPSNGNGSSWAQAYQNLTVALSVGQMGDEFWVAQGSYTTNGSAFQIPADTTLYGGFVGNETMPSERDIDSHPTILDAQMMNRVLKFVGGSTPTTIVDGVHLINGLAGSQGGGMANEYAMRAVFRNCTFSNNRSMDGHGGVVRTYGGEPAFLNCRFLDNVAGGSDGGVMYCYEGAPSFEGCVFDGNVGLNGGVFYSYTGTPRFENCLFVRNRGVWKGSLLVTYEAAAKFVNCTATQNVADGPFMIEDLHDNVLIRNSIFWGNTVNTATTATGSQFTAGLDVSWSCIEGGWPGTGNVSSDPKFLSAPLDDFRLGVPSPCIDSGDNTAVSAGVTTDLDGNLRFIDVVTIADTGNGIAPIVDMGAFETVCESPTFLFGIGCAGAGGFIPSLNVDQCPAIGFPVTVRFADAVGGSTAIVFLGTGQANLPLTPNCSFLLSPVLPPLFSLPLGGFGPGQGSAVLNTIVPTTVPVGVTATVQFFVVDAAAPDGFAGSNGLSITFN